MAFDIKSAKSIVSLPMGYPGTTKTDIEEGILSDAHMGDVNSNVQKVSGGQKVAINEVPVQKSGFDLSTSQPIAKPNDKRTESTPNATKQVDGISRTDKILKGAKDPVDAAAQLLTHILPEGVVNAGNKLNNFIADKTGLVSRVPEGGIDQMINQDEAAYQAKRTAQGESGLDAYRLAGNIVSPVNLAIAAKVPAGATLASKLLNGAAAGAGINTVAAPVVNSKDYVGDKAKQAAIGAVGGLLVPAVANAAGRVISPNAASNASLKTLQEAGVTPTVGQTLGGAFNRAEEKLTSIPIVGDMIRSARNKADTQFQAAAYNKALSPLGETLPAGMTGREALNHTESTLSNAYDKVLNKIGAITPDTQFNTGVNRVKSMVDNLVMPKSEKMKFSSALSDLQQSIDKNGVITSDAYKALESSLGSDAQKLYSSQNIYDSKMAPAVKQLQQELKDMLGRQAGSAADELKNINTGYANFKRVQKAAGSIGAESGEFSPAQYQSAIKAADKSKDKGAFARGDALGQDLGDAGKAILGNKVPNSGTVDRALLSGGTLLASLLNPTVATGIGAGAVAYTPAIQKLLNAAITKRPELASPLAQLLRENSNKITPAAVTSLTQLLNN